ncbi:hypothetical protein, partial [Alienimonas chondri]|uniref:hypothetical protein n=1 Tax=Alienimonas chondri TaxID=2681879 RepID=UPI00148977FB
MNTPPPILRAKLDRILNHGLCFVRNNISGRHEADASTREEIFQVCDALEVIPTFFHRWDEESEPFIREVIGELRRAVPHLGERFQMFLDMPDEEYADCYLRGRSAPQAAPAPPIA